MPSIRKSKNLDSEKSQLAIREDGIWLTPGFNNLFEQFRRSFDELMTPLRSWNLEMQPLTDWIRGTPLDLEDYGDHYKVTAELRGFDKDNVNINVGKNSLVISAERKTENEQKDSDALSREHSYSTFRHAVNFPEEVVSSKADATMKNGILQVTVPKKHSSKIAGLRNVPVKG